MRFVCADGIPDSQEMVSAAMAPLLAAGHEFEWFEEPLDGIDDWVERLGDAAGLLLLLDVPAAVFERSPSLRVVSFAGTGTEQYVDVDAAARADVTVCNVPSYGANAVAEHALALFLAVTRRIVDGDRIVRAGEWSHESALELAGGVLGVIGAGSIGARMLEIGRGLGASTLAWTRHPTAERAERLGTRFVSLEELLESSDFVSVHLPHLPETERFLSAAMLERMRPGAVLVNTGRAGVVDSGALARMLAEGRLYGAGIDVFDAEPPNSDDPLLTAPRTVLSPHVAYDTPGALADVYRSAAANLAAFADGDPINVVLPSPAS
jgi:D-3-phosphoglycerate dehydrogenase